MVMPTQIRELWGNRLYGCMACQEACPINHKVKPKDRKPDHGYVGPSLPLISILQMNEREYRRLFRKNQIGEPWVSFGAIQRNAAVALGNIGDPVAVPVLAQKLNSSRSKIVKMHAAWALGKIGGEEAKCALRQALKGNQKPEVRKEVESALKQIGT
jgi:epoxyqueuosine reductase